MFSDSSALIRSPSIGANGAIGGCLSKSRPSGCSGAGAATYGAGGAIGAIGVNAGANWFWRGMADPKPGAIGAAGVAGPTSVAMSFGA